jgi:hypothetical protein
VSEVFLRPGDVFRNTGELWVVDYVNDCGATALQVYCGVRTFVARDFGNGLEPKKVVVPQARKVAHVSNRIEAAEVLHRVPGYVRGRRVYEQDFPEGLRSAASADTTKPAIKDNERKVDMPRKAKVNKSRARGGLAVENKELKARLGALGGIMGASATAVVRALAKHGASLGHCKAIVAAQGVKMKDTTAALQHAAGRNGKTGGKDGKPVNYPDLTKAQLEQLMGSAEDPKAAKAEEVSK